MTRFEHYSFLVMGVTIVNVPGGDYESWIHNSHLK